MAHKTRHRPRPGFTLQINHVPPPNPPPHPTSILVIGAGELGTAILSALTTHPNNNHTSNTTTTTKIAVLRRASTLASPDPAQQSAIARLASLGITSETGDFIHSPLPELIAVFAKYNVVIQAGGYGAPGGTLLRVAEAAVAAGVRVFVPWQFGVDYAAVSAADQQGGGGGGLEASGHGELFGEMLAVRAMLRGQNGTRWVVVSTGLFMSFLFLRGFGAVDLEGKVLRGLGGWGNRVTVTDVDGIGRMVAEVVYQPPDGNVVYVAGDTVSYGEVADIVEGVYGGGFKREVWDREYLRKRLEEEPEDLMLKYQNAFAAGVGYVKENKNRLTESAD
ncbi:isoflavone reductase P3 [Chaetomidium leptoderma]|uniref:Isoflavone reductase P3 n=1 Tax=Chaetomidium leptoderma TaxID=669021 RepID=A0AAN6ZVI1_9PEZI|nr:isoflavone reductase P3 [Chaetomidium leptoderma]